MGININDSTQDFTGQILRGEKTIETRKTRSLDPYIGERVGLVRTGVGKATLVGYATVGEPVVYDSVAKFRRDYDKHLVAPGSAFDMKDRLKYGYPLMQVESVEPRVIESRGIVARKVNPYTKPDLRERLKRKIMAGSKGGNPGQWSARKAQLLAAEYEKAGGGYTGGRSKSQQSLSRWTKQDWRTKSGKPALETGERYLPAAAIEKLSAAEYAATSRAKRKATGQFSRQPRRIAMKTKEFRNPATFDDFPPAQGSRAKSPQIDTPAFKKWFGESEVVTRNGKPRIMYHGTGWTNLSEFRSYRSRNQIAGFFAFDPEFASQFAEVYAPKSFSDDEEDDSGIKKAATIYPVYLSLKKVFDVRNKEDRDAVDFDKLAVRDGWVEGRNGWTWTVLEHPELVKRMKRSGFDSFLDFESGSKLEPTGIAVFDPRNIKSAIGNRGTFDPMDPDITNPKDPRSAMTQIATTVNTYRKASKMLGGKVLDYGAGYGLGTDAMREEGLLADSFEPFPEEWKGKRPPVYTDSADIPSESYDSLVSFSVVNVVDPDERKLLFKEVARILRPDGFALITGRTRQDVSAAKIKTPHLEEGGYLIGVGEDQRYQKGFTQAELERYAKEVLGPGFTVETNRALNGASIKITKGKVNPAKRDNVRSKLSRIIEPGDRILCYDTASGEDFYRLWDVIHTAMPMTKEALVEVEGMLDDDGVLVIESGESPAGLQDHFRKATRYNGLLLVQGPKNPENARIETEKLRRELE